MASNTQTMQVLEVISVLLLDCALMEADVTDHVGELRRALAEYLDDMELSYWRRAIERREQFPQIWLHSPIRLPGPEGSTVEFTAVAHYHCNDEPDRVDILYGGEGRNPPLSTWTDTWHGHIVVYRNDRSPSGIERWQIINWLAPGVRGNREQLWRAGF